MKFFEGMRSGALTAFFGAFSLLGETAFFALIVLTLLFFLPRGMRIRVLISVLVSVALNALLKFTVMRPRPYLTGEIIKLDPPLSRPLNPNTSFPSGHVQLVATLCGSLVTGKNRTLFLLPIPVIVAVARMYFGVHYPTDVLFGLFFGFAVPLAVRALPSNSSNA